MLTIYKHEMKLLYKTLLIWTLVVGGMCFFCILLFNSIKSEIEGMSESFAQMGAFADAFGMSQLSVATLEGFYATEVGMIHGLGAAMFAAIISMNMLSKEEDGHTGEFLFTLPVSRAKVITTKLIAIITNIIIFNIISVGAYIMAIVILGEDINFKRLLLYHGMQLIMHLEISAICFSVSSFMKKNRLGYGIGIVMILYAYDIISRVIPALSDYKAVSPFSYSNATDIISTGEIQATALVMGMVVMVIGIIIAYVQYSKKDLAA